MKNNDLSLSIKNNAISSNIGNIGIGRKRVYSKFEGQDFIIDSETNIEKQYDYLCSIVLKLVKYNENKFNILYINVDKAFKGKMNKKQIFDYDLQTKIVTLEELNEIYFTNDFKELRNDV